MARFDEFHRPAKNFIPRPRTEAGGSRSDPGLSGELQGPSLATDKAASKSKKNGGDVAQSVKKIIGDLLVNLGEKAVEFLSQEDLENLARFCGALDAEEKAENFAESLR